MLKDCVDKSFKRHFISFDVDLIHTYMESARIFKAKIYVQAGSDYSLINDLQILEVNIENKHIQFNVALDLPASKELRFMILLERCAIDFLTTAHASENHKTIQLFSFPKQITVYYGRTSLRVSPSLDFAVTAALFKGQKFITYNVLDLSTRGMAVKVPHAATILKIGERIGTIEISLPGQVMVRVHGEIRAIRDERCGIKFLEVDQETQKKLDDYVKYRQLVKKISAKTYKNVEKELIKFMK